MFLLKKLTFLSALIIAIFLVPLLTLSQVCEGADCDKIDVLVRNGSEVGYSSSIEGRVNLTVPTAPAVAITPNSGTTSPVSVEARSVIATLQRISGFSLSHIGFFDFGAPYSGGLYIKCLTIASDACDNWQYKVNGQTPNVGVGSYALNANDALEVYFGYTHRILLSTNTTDTATPFTATAERYDAATDTYVRLTGVTIGVFTGSSFSPTEITTAAVDGSGEATFTLSDVGTYGVGIQDAPDFYFPSENITVAEVVAPPAPPSGGGGSSSAGPRPMFDVPRALSYLASQQGMGGSYANAMLGDWVAIAFAVGGADVAKNRLREYYASSTPLLSSVTDYERHAMALEALDINPYSGSTADFIAPILQAFDGTQVGDPNLINDDVFAIFPLLRAGFAETDEFIQRLASFIISKQRTNGSWENSIDFTSATIQALALTKSAPGVSAAISKARGFLSSQQKSNGSVGDEYGTSWALQAIAAMNEPASNWVLPSTFGPIDYLAFQQQGDGGVSLVGNNVDLRIWATAYAVPGVAGKTWYQLLQQFEKPIGYSPAPVPTPLPAPLKVTSAPTHPTVLGTTTVETSITPKQIEQVFKKVIEPVLKEEAVRATTTPSSTKQTAAASASASNFPVRLLILLVALLFVYGVYKSREKFRRWLRNRTGSNT